jgi:hypothetical protein
MPVESGKNEQTSREDILPRKIVAAVKKRLHVSSLSLQIAASMKISPTQSVGRTQPTDFSGQKD